MSSSKSKSKRKPRNQSETLEEVIETAAESSADDPGDQHLEKGELTPNAAAAQRTVKGHPNHMNSNSPAEIRTMIADEVTNALSSKAVIDTIVDAVYNRLYKKLADELHAAFKLELNRSELRMDALATTLGLLSRMVTELQSSLEEQEQYSRRQCLRIYGLPESRGENTDDLVISLAGKMGVTIDKQDIDRSHRIRPRRETPSRQTPDQPARPKPLIVKFARYNVRRLMYGAKSRLKGTGIVIREDLTATRQALFSRTSSHQNTKYTWTIDGRIFTLTRDGRKIPVRNASDVERLD